MSVNKVEYANQLLAENERLKQQVQQLAAQNVAAMDIVGRLIGQYSCAGYHAVQNSNTPAQSLLYDAMQVEKVTATAEWLNDARAQGLDMLASQLNGYAENHVYSHTKRHAEDFAAQLRAGEVKTNG